MNKQFQKMATDIEGLKTQLSTIDGRRSQFCAEHAAALGEKEKLEKELVKGAVHGAHDRKETEAKYHATESNLKNLAAILTGFSTERERLKTELDAARRALGDYLTDDAGGWVKSALKEYEKSLQAFAKSIERLLAANRILADYGGSPAAIYGRFGAQWTCVFGPALYSLQGGKAQRLELRPDQKTMDTVKRELLG